MARGAPVERGAFFAARGPRPRLPASSTLGADSGSPGINPRSSSPAVPPLQPRRTAPPPAHLADPHRLRCLRAEPCRVAFHSDRRTPLSADFRNPRRPESRAARQTRRRVARRHKPIRPRGAAPVEARRAQSGKPPIATREYRCNPVLPWTITAAWLHRNAKTRLRAAAGAPARSPYADCSPIPLHPARLLPSAPPFRRGRPFI